MANDLLIRGGTLIDGTGAPAIGPMDIVIEGNRIAQIKSVGFPGVAIQEEKRPVARPGDEVMELEGHYVLPGFVDLHGHIGGREQGTPAEYVLKLWMGHGITTICDPSTENGLRWVMDHKEKSLANTITAPRIEAYPSFGLGLEEPISTPDEARAWVDEVASMGANGVKFFGARPDIMGAAIDQARASSGVGMGHGITTICDPSTENGLRWVMDHKEKSLANTITAPRIEAYPSFGLGLEEPISTPDEARAWVDEVASMGANGVKFFGARPDIMGAAIDQAGKHDMRTTCHHAQLNVSWLNALDSARLGLTSMQHWYGLPEALFEDRTVQQYPADYNYNNEQHRFEQAGRLWEQAAKQGSDHWNEVMEELLDLDFTLSPTFVAYETTRDFMRMRRAEWHEEYTLPSLWRFYEPNREKHASYWFYWTTEIEVAWKRNYQLWMSFVNEYKNRGGRVGVGSDSGYSYNLYGYGFVRELELLREAGFHPLEVIRAATLKGAETLGLSDTIGSVEVGKMADLVIVDENPLENLKVLYGIGAVKLDQQNNVVRVGGVKYTVKDGIVFDAKALLGDVRRIVREAKDKENFAITQPGRSTPFKP